MPYLVENDADHALDFPETAGLQYLVDYRL